MKKILKKGLKIAGILFAGFAILVLLFIGYRQWRVAQLPEALTEVADGDAIFWLMQKQTNRFMPCVVTYTFDQELNETVILERIKKLVDEYEMFHRNVVVVDGLPYWQNAEPNWEQNFRILDSTENVEDVRIQADYDISQPYELGEGLPLFRAYLTANHRELIFIWHHVISDFEGMFNKQAKHLFEIEGERTQFGYQIDTHEKNTAKNSFILKQALANISAPDRKEGFTASGFEVQKIILPIGSKTLEELGKKADLPMSDIFSFITTRAITHYHLDIDDEEKAYIRPIMTPLSLRNSSVERDEGNNRAIKLFPLKFPLESVEEMHQRMVSISPAATSYETTGKNWKILRQIPSFKVESFLMKGALNDYISNYFPLADNALTIDSAKVIGHHLRVPLSPYERTKFAWSTYDDEVQLYLHTDPKLVDKELMIKAFEKSLEEILQFLNKF